MTNKLTIENAPREEAALVKFSKHQLQGLAKDLGLLPDPASTTRFENSPRVIVAKQIAEELKKRDANMQPKPANSNSAKVTRTPVTRGASGTLALGEAPAETPAADPAATVQALAAIREQLEAFATRFDKLEARLNELADPEARMLLETSLTLSLYAAEELMDGEGRQGILEHALNDTRRVQELLKALRKESSQRAEGESSAA